MGLPRVPRTKPPRSQWILVCRWSVVHSRTTYSGGKAIFGPCAAMQGMCACECSSLECTVSHRWRCSGPNRLQWAHNNNETMGTPSSVSAPCAPFSIDFLLHRWRVWAQVRWQRRQSTPKPTSANSLPGRKGLQCRTHYWQIPSRCVCVSVAVCVDMMNHTTRTGDT